MPPLLQDVAPGTPVNDRTGARLGEVRALYSSGNSRVVEFMLVFWDHRGAEALVPSDDVATIDGSGVNLMGTAVTYDALAAFDPADNPQLHRL